jgi:hypothetical protein
MLDLGGGCILGNKIDMGTPICKFPNLKWKPNTLWIVQLRWQMLTWKEDKYGIPWFASLKLKVETWHTLYC